MMMSTRLPPSISKLSFVSLLCALLLSLAGAGRAGATTPEQAQAIRLVPGTVSASDQMQAAVVEALGGAQAVFAGSNYFAITDVRQEQDWALVSVIGLAQVRAGQTWSIDDGTWFGLVLLRQTRDGSWQGWVRGTSGFDAALSETPDSLLDSTAKVNLGAGPASSAQSTGSFVFPWQSNTSMLYGANGIHDNGFSFGSHVGWVAVDMMSDGDTGAGHAPNRLLAAEAGTIGYKCKDSNNVAILLGDFFYTHLQDNPGLAVGSSFVQGAHLGQMKVGSFGSTGSGCGWATQPDGWFHVHWGFPNADLQVEDWTLSMSTQAWTNGTTTVAPGEGWIKARGIQGDDIDTPLDLAVFPFDDTRDTTLMSAASGDPIATACGLTAGLATTWYRYVPSSNGLVSINTFGSNYDTYLAVWTGTRGSLSAIACNNDSANTVQSRLWFSASAGTTYYVEVAQVNGAATDPVITPGGGTLNLHARLGIQTRADFDGNGTSDIAVFTPSTGVWSVRGQFNSTWGILGDVPVPGDYSGDGRANLAVWRPSTGVFYVKGLFNSAWGSAGDVPVPGDYNGDGRTDIAVWRPATGTWYVKGLLTATWGQAGDIPVPADYNGDGITDLAVFRPSTGTWYIKGQFNAAWGALGDIPVPADYNGDGKADVAVYRPSTGVWYVKGLFNSAWGNATDLPVPADYDGNGSADVTVWRPSTGTWFVKGLSTTTWGSSADWPLEAPDTNGDGIPYQ